MTEDGNGRKRWIAVPVVLSMAAMIGIVLALFNVGGSSLTPAKLYTSLVLPLIRLLCFLAAGLLVGQLVETMGWTRRLSRRLRPVLRWAHLKDDSGAAFVAGFVSGIVANTMLMAALQEGRITRRELIVAYVLNNGLPMYLVHLPSTFFIVISLTGAAGLVYLAVTFFAACARSLGALIYARLGLPAPSESRVDSGEPSREPKEGVAAAVWKKFRDRFTRLLAYTLPIYVLVFLINDWGVFLWMRNLAVNRISTEFFPIEAAGLIVFALAAEFTSGMAAAGALLDTGTLTVKQAALALIAGSIVATPFRAVRHQLPTHAGIFNLGLAGVLLFLSQGLRIASLLVVTAVYVALF